MEIIVDLCNQHHGSLSELKRMSLNAWTAGADVVKVQLMDSEKFFGSTEKKYRDIDFETFASLNDFCVNLGIPLMATPFDMERFDWIKSLGIKRYKISSRTAKQDPELCKAILRENKPTIISTGHCAKGEWPYGLGEKISYLFCVSKYPTFLHDPALKAMPEEFTRYSYHGYSDHAIGSAAALQAYFRGAKILEKHYSEDPLAQSKFEGGHLGSFDQKSLKQFKDLIKELEILRSK
jgi:sialic acid synthase SpsE